MSRLRPACWPHPHRVEDPVELRFGDDRTVVVYGDGDVIRRPPHVDRDRGALGAVLHRVGDDIPERLAEPRRVPVAPLLDSGGHTDLTSRMGQRDFIDDVAHDLAQFHLGPRDHAAWIAQRTLTRRLARTRGTRPAPVDTEPLALQRRGGQEVILASGRSIAVLVRPGADSPAGPDSFGFEVAIPSPTTGIEVRGLAYLIYRTLRKSGLRWALWRPKNAVAGSELAYAREESAPNHGTNVTERAKDVARRLRQWASTQLASRWRRAPSAA